MSALAMILTAAMVVPGNGPEMVSGEVERGLDLSGEWEGKWCDQIVQGGIPILAKVESGTFSYRFKHENSFISIGKFHDEGEGKFRFEDQGCIWLGIYRQDRGTVILCFHEADQRRPHSFETGDHQDLLILHHVKPRK